MNKKHNQFKQIHCTLDRCNYKWVTAAFSLTSKPSFPLPFSYSHPSKWCTYSTHWQWTGWCLVKLLPSQHSYCAHHTTTRQFTVLLKATCVASLLVHAGLGYFSVSVIHQTLMWNHRIFNTSMWSFCMHECAWAYSLSWIIFAGCREFDSEKSWGQNKPGT